MDVKDIAKLEMALMQSCITVCKLVNKEGRTQKLLLLRVGSFLLLVQETVGVGRGRWRFDGRTPFQDVN